MPPMPRASCPLCPHTFAGRASFALGLGYNIEGVLLILVSFDRILDRVHRALRGPSNDGSVVYVTGFENNQKTEKLRGRGEGRRKKRRFYNNEERYILDSSKKKKNARTPGTCAFLFVCCAPNMCPISPPPVYHAVEVLAWWHSRR